MRQRWPGLHCIRQLADGEPLTSTWYDRTQQHHARRKGEDADPSQHATTETVTFSPLPCWKHPSPEAYQERVAKMGLEIEEEAAVIRKRTGVSLSRRLAPFPLPPAPFPLTPCRRARARRPERATRRRLWAGAGSRDQPAGFLLQSPREAAAFL